MRIINLTPHEIIIALPLGGTHVIPSTGIARCVEQTRRYEPIAVQVPIEREGGVVGYEHVSIPTTLTTPTRLDGLPDAVDGTYYVVSIVTADAADAFGRGTRDLLIPGQQIRDTAGRIVGCESLVRYQPMCQRISNLWPYAARVLAHTVAYSTQVSYGYTADLPAETASDLLNAATVIGAALVDGPDGALGAARLDHAIEIIRRDLALTPEQKQAAIDTLARMDAENRAANDAAMVAKGYTVHRTPPAPGGFFEVTHYTRDEPAMPGDVSESPRDPA